jgi:hypothetical protein
MGLQAFGAISRRLGASESVEGNFGRHGCHRLVQWFSGFAIGSTFSEA